MARSIVSYPSPANNQCQYASQNLLCLIRKPQKRYYLIYSQGVAYHLRKQKFLNYRIEEKSALWIPKVPFVIHKML